MNKLSKQKEMTSYFSVYHVNSKVQSLYLVIAYSSLTLSQIEYSRKMNKSMSRSFYDE